MSSYCQRPEGSEVTAVLEGKKAKRNDDKQNCLLVHMPAKKKRSIATESDCTDECFPRRLKEEFDQENLVYYQELPNKTEQ